MKGYAIPLECVRSCLRVTAFSAGRNCASSLSSKPMSIFGSFHSGRIVEASSSSLSWPRSTHCITAMVVKSLVHQPIQWTASLSCFSRSFISGRLSEVKRAVFIHSAECDARGEIGPHCDGELERLGRKWAF